VSTLSCQYRESRHAEALEAQALHHSSSPTGNESQFPTSIERLQNLLCILFKRVRYFGIETSAYFAQRVPSAFRFCNPIISRPYHKNIEAMLKLYPLRPLFESEVKCTLQMPCYFSVETCFFDVAVLHFLAAFYVNGLGSGTVGSGTVATKSLQFFSEGKFMATNIYTSQITIVPNQQGDAVRFAIDNVAFTLEQN
jgi:hypothetical protein